MARPKKSTSRQVHPADSNSDPTFLPSAEIDKVLSSIDRLAIDAAVVKELEKMIKVLGKAHKLDDSRNKLKLQEGELSKAIGDAGFEYLKQLESSSDLSFLRNEAVTAFAACKLFADRLTQYQHMLKTIFPALVPVFKNLIEGDGVKLEIALSLREELDVSNARIQTAIDARSRGGAAVNKYFREKNSEAEKWLETNFIACASMRDAARKLISQKVVSVTEQTAYEWVRRWSKNKKSSVC
jgi:hypothetical protein